MIEQLLEVGSGQVRELATARLAYRNGNRPNTGAVPEQILGKPLGKIQMQASRRKREMPIDGREARTGGCQRGVRASQAGRLVGWLAGCLIWGGGLSWQSELRAETPPAERLGYKLLYSDRFDSDTTGSYEFSDPQAWRWLPLEGRGVLSQFQASKVQTPVRSPFNRALVRNLTVGDFVLDVKLQSTIKDYDHRDLCLFFGFQDPAHLYYVHLGKKADDHANQIFIVNGEPRKKISLQSTAGTAWTDDWHQARVVRKVATGTIEVYFDNMETPVMRAEDKTFLWGQVGVGSFDDTGNFDELTVFGERVVRPAGK